MNTQVKTAVDILQELIVMHTTRVECSSKMLSKQVNEPLKTKFDKIIVQSNLYIEALMAELSNFGDAVKADVDRSNLYNRLYNNLLGEFETLEISLLDDQFNKMEDVLKNNYTELINAEQALSASILKILKSQMAGL